MYIFLKNLHHLEGLSTEPITIWSGSLGGDVSYGFSIFDAIKHSKCDIVYIATGIAASMGTIIPQAAKTRLITPNTTYLIHEGYVTIEDTEPKAASSNMQSAKLSVRKFYDVYISRCKNGPFFKDKTDKWIKTYLKKQLMKHGDWNLEPDEIIDLGFADGILGEGDYKNHNLPKTNGVL
jgi:ATP-dependent protease ClpP protease subunit